MVSWFYKQDLSIICINGALATFKSRSVTDEWIVWTCWTSTPRYMTKRIRILVNKCILYTYKFLRDLNFTNRNFHDYSFMNGYQTLLYKEYRISSIKFSQTELDLQNLHPSKFCTYIMLNKNTLGIKKCLAN